MVWPRGNRRPLDYLKLPALLPDPLPSDLPIFASMEAQLTDEELQQLLQELQIAKLLKNGGFRRNKSFKTKDVLNAENSNNHNFQVDTSFGM